MWGYARSGQGASWSGYGGEAMQGPKFGSARLGQEEMREAAVPMATSPSEGPMEEQDRRFGSARLWWGGYVACGDRLQ